jgi:hypothetical protein
LYSAISVRTCGSRLFDGWVTPDTFSTQVELERAVEIQSLRQTLVVVGHRRQFVAQRAARIVEEEGPRLGTTLKRFASRSSDTSWTILPSWLTARQAIALFAHGGQQALLVLDAVRRRRIAHQHGLQEGFAVDQAGEIVRQALQVENS